MICFSSRKEVLDSLNGIEHTRQGKARQGKRKEQQHKFHIYPICLVFGLVSTQQHMCIMCMPFLFWFIRLLLSFLFMFLFWLKNVHRFWWILCDVMVMCVYVPFYSKVKSFGYYSKIFYLQNVWTKDALVYAYTCWSIFSIHFSSSLVSFFRCCFFFLSLHARSIKLKIKENQNRKRSQTDWIDKLVYRIVYRMSVPVHSHLHFCQYFYTNKYFPKCVNKFLSS